MLLERWNKTLQKRKRQVKILLDQKTEIECLSFVFLLRALTQGLRNAILCTVLNCLALLEKCYI